MSKKGKVQIALEYAAARAALSGLGLLPRPLAVGVGRRLGALAYTLAAWCVSLAAVVQVSMLEQRLALHPLVLTLLLAITAPITTVLLARAVLFRQRQAGEDVPAPLSATRDTA